MNGTVTRRPDHVARILHAQAPVPKVPAEVVDVKTTQRLAHLCENRSWRFLHQCFNMFRCERKDILH